jgi:hypothetical protein
MKDIENDIARYEAEMRRRQGVLALAECLRGKEGEGGFTGVNVIKVVRPGEIVRGESYVGADDA